MIYTFYPAQGGHNDNMTAGWIARNTVSLLDNNELQAEYLFNKAYDWSHITPEIMTTLRYWYGAGYGLQIT